jgi:hypothetical protein
VTRHKYTPGQKYAHWEHRGVKVRVEVGPNEANKNCCTVALTRAPGVPAERFNSVSVRPDALPARLLELEQQLTQDSAAGTQGGAQAALGAGNDEADRAAADDVPAGAAQSRRGGDDLDDGFELPRVEAEDDENGKKRKKVSPASGGGKEEKAAKKQKASKGSKAPKEVTF